MKLNFTHLISFSGFLLFSLSAYSQDLSATVIGGEYQFNKSQTPCLTDVQRKEVLMEVKSNIHLLKSQERLAYDESQQRKGHTLFSWPIKMKDGAPYNDVWGISNYVDQNPDYPNKIKDYNCGSKSYDTAAGYNHMGVDIFTWPFSWKMMDNDEAEIVAAASGQIIAINRSQFDRSCTFNDNVWNAVYVQHADGSVALYGHMKKNSPTSKQVGDTVERGEYLGIVGSSGNSTGPHLHFEVYSEIEWNGVGTDVLVDPYEGTCNTMNDDSWWVAQKPYKNPKINAMLTHSNIPVFPECSQIETTYESNDFDANDLIHFGIYLRDQLAGTSVNLKIIKPDNSILYHWTYDLVANYNSSWWMWYYSGVYDMNGQWKWQATYQGETVTHTFNVTGVLQVEDEDFSTTSIYPNPFKDRVNIKSKTPVRKVSVVDMLGKTVLTKTEGTVELTEINLESLSKGLYFMILEGGEHQKKIIKLVKQ